MGRTTNLDGSFFWLATVTGADRSDSPLFA
jgi:hypothetical protein